MNDSASFTGNTGVWTQLTVDPELGIAYLPVEMPTGDEYGGHRPGDNLFGESLVAVDVETGERIWHFQLVHHPIWDYDIPSAPILADIVVDGREIKAIAQPSKQGWLYVFDRQTGEPVWPIEERPVPAGDVPGEWYSPTQPFPTKPPPYERQGFELEELLDLTPELRDEAMRIAEQYQSGPIFTPPIALGSADKFGTLFVPNGAQWPGGSYDPETGILYIFSRTLVRLLALVNDPDRSDMDFISIMNAGVPRDAGTTDVRVRVSRGELRADGAAGWGACPRAGREDRIEVSCRRRPVAERCNIYRGIPAFPTGYNNNCHIAQTPGYVAILPEHIHEVRLLPLDGRPHESCVLHIPAS